MSDLDRLGWAAGIRFVSHGARIGIRVNDPAVLNQLPRHLPPGWSPSESPEVDELYSVIVGGSKAGARFRHYNLLYLGSTRLARTLQIDDVFDLLESDMHFQVAQRAQDKLFVQAGVVSWQGRAIVVPGRSMSGKTSLVAALVRAGATYYSDEYAVFDHHGRVHPYPKPLSVRDAEGGRRHKLPVEAFGGQAGTVPLQVGLIVVTEYRKGGRWVPRLLPPGQALLALLNNTVLARVKPAFALQTLRRVVPGTRAIKGTRGESETVVAPLLKQLETFVASEARPV